MMDIVEVNEYFGTWDPGTVEALAKHLDGIHAAFPGKPIVISEYGYCACTPDRPEGDHHRVEALRSHDAVFRTKEFVAGAIYFCYNDYRSQVGPTGVGALRQNVHGVVNLFGRRKPSYDALQEECSPIESVSMENRLNAFHLRLKTRQDIPMYTLQGYKVRGIFYGEGDVPLERQEVDLPEIASGGEITLDLSFRQPGVPLHVTFDVLRPTGFSAYSRNWKP
jgi:beta-glucuronidase